MNRRRSFATTAVVSGLLLTLAATGCGGTKIKAGSRPALLLVQVNSDSADVTVGDEFVYGVVLLQSTSDDPVTIDTVTFTQPKGLGDVVKPLEIDVAHLSPSDDWPVRNWRSFPPTAKIDGTCRAMEVEPAAGAVIRPHEAARLIVLFKAVGAGDYFLGGQDVEYTVGPNEGSGTPGSIVMPNRFLGTVSTDGGTLQPDPIETACKQMGNLPPR